MSGLSWLPDLELFENYGGDWDRYLDALYEFFKTDFIDSQPVFRGLRLGLKRHPLSMGKEATFWHLISEGKDEDERVIDFRRCERIRWPRPTIEHANEPVIKVWENERRGEKRVCLWLESEEYLAVLAQRKGYILPWTAFLVTLPHEKRKRQKEYEEFQRKNKARNS
jgi:hypothetical protein